MDSSGSAYTVWHAWLGLPHRLGADPRDGEACCCLRMVHIVMQDQGLNPPEIDERWDELARQRRWTDLYEEFERVTREAEHEELWSLVPMLTPISFGIGVVVPDRLILAVHHRYGLTTLPIDQLRSPTFHKPL